MKAAKGPGDRVIECAESKRGHDRKTGAGAWVKQYGGLPGESGILIFPAPGEPLPAPHMQRLEVG